MVLQQQRTYIFFIKDKENKAADPLQVFLWRANKQSGLSDVVFLTLVQTPRLNKMYSLSFNCKKILLKKIKPGFRLTFNLNFYVLSHERKTNIQRKRAFGTKLLKIVNPLRKMQDMKICLPSVAVQKLKVNILITITNAVYEFYPCIFQPYFHYVV